MSDQTLEPPAVPEATVEGGEGDAPTTEVLEGPVGEPTQEPDRGAVLGIFAHPDDMEISSGATLAKWAAEGRPVHLLILTNGDRGSDDPGQDRAELAATRVQEQARAAEILGLTSFRILDVHDGELENTLEVREQVVRVIRETGPARVVTCDPTAWFFGNRYYNHSDHRTAGVIALDSVFPAAGNPLYFEEQLAEGLETWKVAEVWLAWSDEANHYEDVSGGFVDRKMNALAEHKSQLFGDAWSFFEQWLPTEAAENGSKIGAEHAEPFRVLDLS